MTSVAEVEGAEKAEVKVKLDETEADTGDDELESRVVEVVEAAMLKT